MPVLRLTLAYDGTDFHGFARQPRVRTVEGVLTEALSRVLTTPPKLSVAGRTDAGVHAEGQVVSFEADAEPERLQRALNGRLAPEVVVSESRLAPEGFDARHSATGREYRYRIRSGLLPDPFSARYEWHRPGTHALGAMRQAARDLVGEHDFRSFCRADGRSTVRKLTRLSVRRQGDLLEIGAGADGFLHQMVRSLVGTLVEVGEGNRDPASMPVVLASRSRQAAGRVAPSRGLTLVRVHYGAHPRRAGSP
ncbi:MAG: tRNA pseudouridine(38-40) synthase TruA [Actinomycetota bacterium]